jgi:hypothetical protein
LALPVVIDCSLIFFSNFQNETGLAMSKGYSGKRGNGRLEPNINP